MGDRLPALEAAARELAQILNCQKPPRRFPSGYAIAPCGACRSCRNIHQDTHPDVEWLRPESKLRVITIDQIRDLMRTIHLKPYEAEYKVSVIVAADRLNEQSANAFLKTLEEPPEKTLLLLLTTEPERVMETILSRCLRLVCTDAAGAAFSPTAQDFLRDFGDHLATAAEKGLLGKYRLLGMLQQRLSDLRGEIEKELTARSPLEKYEDAEPQQRERWQDELTAAIEAEYRLRRSELLNALQCWFRDIWLACSSQTQDLFFFPELAAQTQAIARRLAPSDAQENLEAIERTHRLLHTNVQEALTLEVCLLKLKL
jgi:DNA polymerase-3 subunit delta'